MPVTDTPSLASLIQAVEAADSAAALVQAVRALAATRSAAAIAPLITVLGYNNPGAAVAAVDGLVALGREAVPALLQQLDGYNYGARAWAIRALAMIGDARALAVLVEAAQGDFALSVRRAAARGLGFIDWQQLPPDQRPAAQARACTALQAGLEDPEWVVRYAAVVGLSALATTLQAQGDDITALSTRLQTCAATDPEGVVRARAHWALTHLPPAATQD